MNEGFLSNMFSGNMQDNDLKALQPKKMLGFLGFVSL